MYMTRETTQHLAKSVLDALRIYSERKLTRCRKFMSDVGLKRPFSFLYPSYSLSLTGAHPLYPVTHNEIPDNSRVFLTDVCTNDSMWHIELRISPPTDVNAPKMKYNSSIQINSHQESERAKSSEFHSCGKGALYFTGATSTMKNQSSLFLFFFLHCALNLLRHCVRVDRPCKIDEKLIGRDFWSTDFTVQKSRQCLKKNKVNGKSPLILTQKKLKTPES